VRLAAGSMCLTRFGEGDAGNDGGSRSIAGVSGTWAMMLG